MLRAQATDIGRETTVEQYVPPALIATYSIADVLAEAALTLY